MSDPKSAQTSSADSTEQLLAHQPARKQISPRHLGKLDKALQAVVEPSREHDPPFVIWVSGAAGVGKSALVAAGSEHLAEEAQFLTVEAYRHTGEILEPILTSARRLLSTVRGRANAGDTEWRRVWNVIVGRHAPALDRVLPELDWGEVVRPYPDLDPQHERGRLIDHLAGVFVRVAERIPVILHVDSAEHLDEPSRDLLMTLARIVRTRRQGQRAELPLPAPPRLALVLATNSEQERPLEVSEDEILQLVLHGLGREEFGRLLEEEYGEVPLSTREKVFQVCRGNPLDLQIRIGRERALRDGRHSGSTSTGAKRLLDFNNFERECYLGRQRLEEGARKIVTVMALMEKPVSAAIIAGVTKESEDTTVARLNQLEVAGWLACRSTGAWALRHNRMVSPLLDDVSGAERTRWHRAIAETIGGVYEKRPYRRFQEVYYHFRHGPQDAAQVEAGFQAAHDALRLYDFHTAIRNYSDLLQNSEGIDSERLSSGISTLAGLLAENVSADRGVLDSLEDLLKENTHAMPCNVAASLWRRLAGVAGQQDQPDRELTFYQRALKVLENQEHSNERLKVYACIARAFLRLRQYDETLDYCQQGLHLSEIKKLEQDPEYLDICRITEEVHFHRGELVEAYQFEQQFLGLARVQGTPKDVLESLLRLAYLDEGRGDSEDAKEHLLEALPVARTTGSRILEARIDERLGYLYSRHEDWDRARESFQRALEVHAEVGDEAQTVRIFGALGMLALSTGDAAGGAANFRLYAFYQSMRRRGQLPSQVPGFPCDYHSRSERDDEIRVREETVHRNGGGHVTVLLDALSELGDLRRDCGELEVARATLRRGLRIADADSAQVSRFYLQLGQLHRVHGEIDSALSCMQKGLDTMMGLTLKRDWLAEYQVQLSRISVAQGNYGRAIHYLVRGLRVYLEEEHDTGVTHSLLELGDLFRRLGQLPAAEELALAALSLADAFAVERLEAESWLLLGRIRSAMGTGSAGLQEVELAREILSRLGILEGRCRVLLAQSSIEHRRGKVETALALCSQALEIARDLALGPLLAEGLVLRGQIEGDRKNRRGDFLSALQTLETALEQIRHLGDKELELRARGVFATLYQQRNRDNVARTELNKVQKLVQELLMNCPEEFHGSYVKALPCATLLVTATEEVAVVG